MGKTILTVPDLEKLGMRRFSLPSSRMSPPNTFPLVAPNHLKEMCYPAQVMSCIYTSPASNTEQTNVLSIKYVRQTNYCRYSFPVFSCETSKVIPPTLLPMSTTNLNVNVTEDSAQAPYAGNSNCLLLTGRIAQQHDSSNKTVANIDMQSCRNSLFGFRDINTISNKCNTTHHAETILAKPYSQPQSLMYPHKRDVIYCTSFRFPLQEIQNGHGQTCSVKCVPMGIMLYTHVHQTLPSIWCTLPILSSKRTEASSKWLTKAREKANSQNTDKKIEIVLSTLKKTLCKDSSDSKNYVTETTGATLNNSTNVKSKVETSKYSIMHYHLRNSSDDHTTQNISTASDVTYLHANNVHNDACKYEHTTLTSDTSPNIILVPTKRQQDEIICTQLQGVAIEGLISLAEKSNTSIKMQDTSLELKSEDLSGNCHTIRNDKLIHYPCSKKRKLGQSYSGRWKYDFNKNQELKYEESERSQQFKSEILLQHDEHSGTSSRRTRYRGNKRVAVY